MKCDQYHKWNVWMEFISKCSTLGRVVTESKTINQFLKCSDCNIVKHWVREYKNNRLISSDILSIVQHNQVPPKNRA